MQRKILILNLNLTLLILTKNLGLVNTVIKLSEMYRISGGCQYDKCCFECDNFIHKKIDQCFVYPKDQNFSWNGKRMACKFFYKNEDHNQMSIMDLLKEMKYSG